MCKKETLAVDGLNPQSDFYIWDIIKEKVNCIWAWHDLLDDDYYVKQDEDYFYKYANTLSFVCLINFIIFVNTFNFFVSWYLNNI